MARRGADQGLPAHEDLIACAVGREDALGGGSFTVEGDAVLRHELGHVVPVEALAILRGEPDPDRRVPSEHLDGAEL